MNLKAEVLCLFMLGHLLLLLYIIAGLKFLIRKNPYLLNVFMNVHMLLDMPALQSKIVTTRKKYLIDAYRFQCNYLKELTTMNCSLISWKCFSSC